MREGTTHSALAKSGAKHLPFGIIHLNTWMLFLPMCLKGLGFSFSESRKSSFSLTVCEGTTGRVIAHFPFLKGTNMQHQHILSKLFQSEALPSSLLGAQEDGGWQAFPLAFMVYLHFCTGSRFRYQRTLSYTKEELLSGEFKYNRFFK